MAFKLDYNNWFIKFLFDNRRPPECVTYLDVVARSVCKLLALGAVGTLAGLVLSYLIVLLITAPTEFAVVAGMFVGGVGIGWFILNYDRVNKRVPKVIHVVRKASQPTGDNF